VTCFDNLELGVKSIIELVNCANYINTFSRKIHANQYQIIDAQLKLYGIIKNKANINNSCYYYNITTMWIILFFYANARIGQSLKSQ
jgi:hypothetical protein